MKGRDMWEGVRKMDEKQKVGCVTHYYTKIGVGIVKLDNPVKLGDRVHFRGVTTDFEQVIDDMQFDHKVVEEGKRGQEVGIKVKEKVREGDCAYAV